MSNEVIAITDPATGSSAEVLASLGFNCFSWRPQLAGGPEEMLWSVDGFRGGGERPSGSGIPILFPFPGRIGAAEYAFEGKTYKLDPGDAHGNAIHGFAFNRPWRVVAAEEDRVLGEFQLSVDAADVASSWPSDFVLAVEYRVAGPKLVMTVEYRNAGEGNLPCALGTHAYFRTRLGGQGADEVSASAATWIQAPVDREWALDQMLPEGEAKPLADETPLADGVALGELKFDTPYGVVAGTDPIVTKVHDPMIGRTIQQTTDGSFGCCVIYTPPHREAVCLEPYTSVPDPFRLEEEGQASGLQVLAPGESRRTEIALEVLE